MKTNIKKWFKGCPMKMLLSSWRGGICTLTFARNFHCNSNSDEWFILNFMMMQMMLYYRNITFFSVHTLLYWLIIFIFFNLITIESWIDYFFLFKDNIILDRIHPMLVIIAILPILQEKKFPRINHQCFECLC